MSDSDDTDVLLLIPPDFFFVAPSPSPASSPLSISPPSPRSRSLVNKNRLPLTEKEAKECLKDLTSQIRIIDRRLSLVESHHSESMDGDNLSSWYDSESVAGSKYSHPVRNSFDRYQDWKSMKVQELLKDSNTRNQLQEYLMTHSLGPVKSQSSMSSSQNYKSLPHGRESISQCRGRDDSSDDEEEMRRGRRATSLPPTPSSSRQVYNSKAAEQLRYQPSSPYQKGRNESVLADIDSRNRQMNAEENARRGLFQEGSQGWREGTQSAPSNNNTPSQWSERSRFMKTDEQKSQHGVGEEGNSTNYDSSGVIDNTLEASAIFPTLSSLGLNASHILPGSLDQTKDTLGFGRGSADGGLTLSQVEKLLQDMHKTQLEMEQSMLRGMTEKEELINKPRSIKAQFNGNDQGQLISESHQGKKVFQTLEMEKKNIEPGKNDQAYKTQGIKRNGMESDGKLQGNPQRAPVNIVVESSSGQFDEGEGGGYRDNTIDPGKGPSERPSIYRSKSDESLSGKHGKSAADGNSRRYLGNESGDDSYFSTGPISASRRSRCGDTIGSVPDLGLGVREFFANLGKRPDPVKEPPFVKKKTWLVGGLDGEPDDVQFAQDNSFRDGNGKIAHGKEKFGGLPSSNKMQDNGFWDFGHLSNANESQPSKKQSNFQSSVASNQERYCSPQKDPVSSKFQRDVSSMDARKQLNFDAESRQPDEVAIRVTENQSVQASKPSGNSILRSQSKENAELQTKGNRERDARDQRGGQVVVVGGDGPRKSLKERKDRGDLEQGKTQNENVRFSSPQKSNASKREEESKSIQGTREEFVDVGSQRGRSSFKEGIRGNEQKGGERGRYGKMSDSGFEGSARSMMRGPPPLADVRRLLTASDVFIPPMSANMVDAAAANEESLLLRRKLDEERFRREHCERVIEEVGRRALEAQERLAVSQGMSKAKDVALGKFHEAWEEAVSGWKKETEGRTALEEELERYKERANAEIAFRDKRLKQLEGQVMQLGDESSSLREELRKGQKENAEITTRLSSMLEVATKEVSNCRKEADAASIKEARSQEEALKACNAAKDALKKLEEETKRADALESEKNLLVQELESLKGRMRDFNGRISTLETRLADAEIATDKARQSEKSSREALASAQKDWESERIKLKEYYQNQVEDLVRAKVNEFQAQLDALERSLKEEAVMREEQAQRSGEERLKILSEKNAQEVNLLEQKHAEEIALWNLRLKRAISEIDNLKDQVSKHNSQKSQLAKGLQTLMQAQLRQGLRLIASGGDVDQERIQSPPRRIAKPTLDASWRDILASLNTPESQLFMPEKEHLPKKDVEYLKERPLHRKGKADKDPEPSTSQKVPSVSNDDLKKYIHMLLGQEPGKAGGGIVFSSESEDDYDVPITDSKHKQYLTMEAAKPLLLNDDHKKSIHEKRRSKKLKTKAAEREDMCKASKDVGLSSWAQAMGLKLSQPTSSVNLADNDNQEQENRRMRKPPWK